MNQQFDLLPQQVLEAAKQLLQFEAEAVTNLINRVDTEFVEAVRILSHHQGKVVITAVGKSGLIGRKIAATFCSTGTPAVFLHSTEAVHGDLGIYSPGDPTIFISKSGTTAELMRLLPILKEFDSPLIGILGNLNSPLARKMDIILDASVVHEADPLNLAPTSSSLVALAIGDALAAALIQVKGFTEDDYGYLHPSGQLGKNLNHTVEDLLHPPQKCAILKPDNSIREVVISLTKFPLGAAVILDDGNHILGIITDGDIRRAFQKEKSILEIKAHEIMTHNPIVVSNDSTIKYALDLMENRKSQISVLPVVDGDGDFQGLLRLHDIYQTNGGE